MKHHCCEGWFAIFLVYVISLIVSKQEVEADTIDGAISNPPSKKVVDANVLHDPGSACDITSDIQRTLRSD
jgi:hypothetical protein